MNAIAPMLINISVTTLSGILRSTLSWETTRYHLTS